MRAASGVYIRALELKVITICCWRGSSVEVARGSPLGRLVLSLAECCYQFEESFLEAVEKLEILL